MPLVYRAPMRSRHDDVDPGSAVERALSERVCGIGGRLPRRPSGLADALELTEEVYDGRTARRLERFAAVPAGSFVWTRDPDGHYLLGRVTGEWRYDEHPDASAADLVNVRDCAWLQKPVSHADVPPAVVHTFGRGGRNFQQIHDDAVGPRSMSLWPTVLVVMGVSGAGKSTVGRLLAQRLGRPFEEGDDLHPSGNVAKMRAGVPLTDEDRLPWLDRVGGWIQDRVSATEGGVITCSALKRSYRERLARPGGVVFVYLAAERGQLEQRVSGRSGHFMPADLVASQLEALEEPGPDEPAVSVEVRSSPEVVVADALAALAESGLHLPAVDRDRVDHEHVEGDDHDRPQRVGRDEREVHD